MLIDRRAALAGMVACAGLTAARPLPGRSATNFVTVRGVQFRRDGRRYPIIGTNMWYAAWLGAMPTEAGRGRLARELDRLAALGIDNVRLLGGSEQSPLHGTTSPNFQHPNAPYDDGLLHGLDIALAELGKRGMTAVVYLNNFWEWSGGMIAYLTYVNGGRFVEAVDPSRPWTDFPDFVSGFYSNERAVALANRYVRAVVGRTNSVTGRRYADDPTIMAWQLANEPRPGGTQPVADQAYPAFLHWIGATARLIKSIDPHHLISTGSEGMAGCLNKAACVLDQNRFPAIDYMTAHIWPQNFGWVKRGALAETFAVGAEKTIAYLDQHAAFARQLGKPLVIEEFGFPRDGGAMAPGSATTLKDRYYRLLLDHVVAGYRAGGPLAGANFWAWNGEARAQHDDQRFRAGDTAFMGDPPHEGQGLYGVFDVDADTQAVIRRFATEMRAATTP